MHLPILPIILPMVFGLLMLIPSSIMRPSIQYRLATVGTISFLLVCGVCLHQALNEGPMLYYLGNWPAGVAISLKLDLLSAGFLMLMAVLALASQQSLLAPRSLDELGKASLESQRGQQDASSPYLYPLFFFQLMGIAGAFLTNDIFNLFVFFEILLISSYALLVSGTQRERIQSVMHYVLLNLMGSAFFLIGLGLMYSAMGTLDITTLITRFQEIPASDNALGVTALSILLLVFMLKAGLFPLQFWLVRTYSNAFPILAALFAIMTKVGLYSILRVHGSVLMNESGALDTPDLDTPDLDVLALAQPLLELPLLEWVLLISGAISIFMACIGMLSSVALRPLIANTVICSMGVLAMTLSTMDSKVISSVLYYTLHTTLVTAALFLLSAVLIQQRGQASDRIVQSRTLAQHGQLTIVFFVLALAVIGLPPFSGFLAKVYILQSVLDSDAAIIIWFAILVSSFITLIAFTRAGTTIFLRANGDSRGMDTRMTLGQQHGLGVVLFSLVLLVVSAAPTMRWSDEAARVLTHHDSLGQAVEQTIEQGDTSSFVSSVTSLVVTDLEDR